MATKSTLKTIHIEAQLHVCIRDSPLTQSPLSVLSPEVCPPEAVSVETSLNWRDEQFLCVELPTALVGEWSVLPVHELAFVSQLEDDC